MARGLAAVLLVWSLCLPPARAASIPDDGIGDTDGVVNATLVTGQFLYIGGSFTQVFEPNGQAAPRNNLAAIELATGAVTAWNPDVGGGAVEAMTLSRDGRALYIGGGFTTVGGIARNNLAVIDTTTDTNNVGDWDPDPDGPVNALALSQDGLGVYVGGAFTAFQGGTVSRAYLASVHALTGDVNPWFTGVDDIVHTLLPSASGTTLFIGGQFAMAGGLARPRLAELELSSGQGTAWNPAPDGIVRALVQDGDLLYVGGDFTAVDGGAPGSRNFLAALDTTATAPGSMDTGWDGGLDGPVHAMALSYDRAILYIGGAFANVNGALPRSRLAALMTGAGGANATAWDPGAAGPSVNSLMMNAAATKLYVGGDFTDINSDPAPDARTGLAAFDVSPPVTTAAPGGGGYPVAQAVTLTCLDNAGGACAAIYVTTDGSTPQAQPGDQYDGNPITIAGNTTLRFFGVDGESNREAPRSEDYYIDAVPPVSSASFPGGSYGILDLEPVTLNCDDGAEGSGCAATYFTVDGSTPTTASSLYRNPLELGDFLPASGAGEVPLKFFSVDNAGNAGAVVTEQYRLDLMPPVTSASLPDGMYDSPQTVTLNCDDGDGFGCDIVYYTTDGSPASDGTVSDINGNLIPPSPVYAQPLRIDSATTINVLSVDKAGNKSAALVGIYSFTRQVDSSGGTGALGGLSLLLPGAMLAWRRRQGKERQ